MGEGRRVFGFEEAVDHLSEGELVGLGLLVAPLVGFEGLGNAVVVDGAAHPSFGNCGTSNGKLVLYCVLLLHRRKKKLGHVTAKMWWAKPARRRYGAPHTPSDQPTTCQKVGCSAAPQTFPYVCRSRSELNRGCEELNEAELAVPVQPTYSASLSQV